LYRRERTGWPAAGKRIGLRYCGELLVFREGLKLDLPTDAELTEWQRHPNSWSLLKNVQKMVRLRRAVQR
jgi:hypothetical protein